MRRPSRMLGALFFAFFGIFVVARASVSISQPLELSGDGETRVSVAGRAVDLNLDGFDDVLLLARFGILSFWTNLNGKGFSEEMVISANVSTRGHCLSWGFVNDDALPDVFSCLPRPTSAVVYFLNLNGSAFSSALFIETASNDIFDVACSDLNGDGRDDVLACFESDLVVGYFLNVNNGTGFSAQYTIYSAHPLFRSDWSIALSDLTLDGFPEVLLDEPEMGVMIFFNFAGAGFSTGQVLNSSLEEVDNMACADLNFDRYPDLVVSSRRQSSFVYFLSSNNGTRFSPIHFGPLPAVPDFAQPRGVALSDMNADGAMDVLFWLGSGRLLVSLNLNGTGFASPVVLASDDFSELFSVGKLNADSFPDLVYNDRQDSTVFALNSRCPYVGGLVWSNCPAFAPVNSAIAIEGYTTDLFACANVSLALFVDGQGSGPAVPGSSGIGVTLPQGRLVGSAQMPTNAGARRLVLKFVEGSASFVECNVTLVPAQAWPSRTTVIQGPALLSAGDVSVSTVLLRDVYGNERTGGNDSVAFISSNGVFPGVWVGGATYTISVTSSTSRTLLLEVYVNGEPANILLSFSFNPQICLPGSYSNAAANGACSPCGMNTYSTAAGQVACQECPRPSIFAGEGASSAANCTCPAGLFLSARDASGAPRCLDCPANARCFGGDLLPQANPGYVRSFASATQFVRCPAPAACPGNSTCAAGYFGHLCSACASGLYRRADGTCVACKGQAAPFFVILVLGIVTACATLLVYLWQPLFGDGEAIVVSFHQAIGAERFRAAKQVWRAVRLMWREAAALLLQLCLVLVLVLFGFQSLAFAVTLCFGIAVLALFTLLRRAMPLDEQALADKARLMPGGSSESLVVALHARRDVQRVAAAELHALAPYVQSLLAFFLVYAQSLGAILSISTVTWPRSTGVLLALANVFSLQLTGLECAGLSFSSQYVFFVLLGPALVAACVLCCAVRLAVLRREQLLASAQFDAQRISLVNQAHHNASFARARGAVRRRTASLALLVFSIVAFPVAQRSLVMFRCLGEAEVRGPGSNVKWLAAAPWIRCYRSDHVRLVFMAMCVLTVLLGLAGVVAQRVVRAARSGDTSAVVAFLFLRYEPRAWWFEGALFALRLLLALALAIASSSDYLVAYVQATLMAIMFFFMQFMPSVHRVVNVLFPLSAVALTLTSAVLALIMTTGVVTNGQALTIGALNGAVIVAYAVVLAQPLVWVLYRMRRARPAPRAQGDPLVGGVGGEAGAAELDAYEPMHDEAAR